MNWSTTIRQIHRWLSLVFTIIVLGNILALILQLEADWLGYLALIPLIFMLFTGLYLFFLPYTRRGRKAS